LCLPLPPRGSLQDDPVDDRRGESDDTGDLSLLDAGLVGFLDHVVSGFAIVCGKIR